MIYKGLVKLAQVILKNFNKLLQKIMYIKKIDHLSAKSNFKTEILQQRMSFLHLTEDHISDTEDNFKSISQNLCLKFEDLFNKNDDNDEMTNNTVWHKSSDFIYQQNANKTEHNQKILQQAVNNTQYTVNNVQYTINNEEKTLIQNSKDGLNQDKHLIIHLRNLKIKKLKSLLPYYYTTEFSTDFKKILKVAQKIDKYLIQRKKTTNYTDNLMNIIRKLFVNEEMSSIWNIVRKIMFLVEGYYKIFVDPLKNLALGISSKKDNKFYARKQKLRKAIADFCLSFAKNSKHIQIPELLVNPIKTSKFYLQAKQSATISTIVCQQSKPPKAYICSLKKKIQEKTCLLIDFQSKLSAQPIQCNHNQDLINQLRTFCQCIKQIYKQKNVTNMYKVSLIQCVRKTDKFLLQNIFKMFRIVFQSQLFLEVLQKSNSHIIHIVPEQMQQMLQYIQLSRQNQP